MNKNFLWFVPFLVVAAVSCWATASSFMLIIPLPWYVIWAMTIVFFVFASFAFKMIMDALHNDGSVENPKVKLWGGIALLIFTWVIISLPTNAHTFFYKLQIGNVVTEDLKTTETYTEQLANAEKQNISKVDSAKYFATVRYCNNELKLFKDEATGTGPSGKRFIDRYSLQHIHNLNNELSNYGKYAIVLPQTTRNDLDTKTEVDNAQLNLDRSLQELKKDFMVSTRNANQARKDLQNIQVMKTVIDSLAQVGLISSPSSEEIIKQAEGILILAYSNIKTNEPYIYISTMRKMRNYIRQQTLKLAHLVSYILTKYLVISSQEKYLLFSSFG
ncbi:MAG: hypothetical protein IJW01_04550 [Paludibacteraceae bacterium]|nr:hypothetical protein [Paludibacteraceae bacterium]